MAMLTRVLVLLPAVFLIACSEKQAEQAPPPPRPVSAFQVGLSEALGQRQLSGLARAKQQAVLSFRVPGQVFSLPFKVGQIAEQGQTVATIDDGPYRAEVTKLEADLDSALADLKLKSDQYDRVMPLVKTGTYPKARGDDALSERNGAEARVESVRSALDRAKIDLNATELKAPFTGRVVAVYPEEFEEVRAQQQIVRMLDIQHIEAVVDVPETMISLVPFVKTLEGRFDAFPDEVLTATIVEVGSEASQVTRTYPVTLAMEQPQDKSVEILPGMAGTFRVKDLNSSEATQVMVVPPDALRPLEPGKAPMAVWVVDPATKKVSLRGVTVGRIVQGGVEIKEGLKPGEWVVTAGANSLSEGEEVRLPQQEAAK